MCGLYGSLTKKGKVLSYPERKIRNQIIKGLAVAMQERGDQGTGIAGVFPENTEIIKQAICAEDFVNDKGFNSLLKKNPQIILGHTRLATIGDISNRNSHPFDYGDIIGCHNGHVANYRDVFEENNIEGEVDSEAIFFLLNKHKNDFRKAFSKMYGTFALTWIDLRNPERLYMIIDGNPLFMIRIPEIQTYFWCSTELSLRTAVAPFFTLKGKELWSPKTEYVYEVNTSFQIKKSPASFKSYYSKPEDVKKEEKEEILKKINEEDEDIKSIVSSQVLLPLNYFERTGCKNPFIKEPRNKELLFDSVDNHYFLMDLKIHEIENIIKNLTSGGCLMCDKFIDVKMEGGVFWHKKEKALLCCMCKVLLQENNNDVIWLIDKDINGLYLDYADWKNNEKFTIDGSINNHE